MPNLYKFIYDLESLMLRPIIIKEELGFIYDFYLCVCVYICVYIYFTCVQMPFEARRWL